MFENFSEFLKNFDQLPLDLNDDELAEAKEASATPLGFTLKYPGW